MEAPAPAARASEDFSMLSLGALALALAGYWAPWLTHPAAALRLNGFELAEWVTFLPGVRDGSLPLNRLAFLAPLACLALLLGLAAARTRPLSARGWRRFAPGGVWGWGLLALALVCGGLVLPPYEAFRIPDYWPEYQPQFLAACAAWLGLAVCQFLPARVNAALQGLLALTGGGCGAWALWTLRPAANELLQAPWAVGLGWVALLAGLAAFGFQSALSGLGRPPGSKKISTGAVIERARQLQAKTADHPASDAEITEAKTAGRP